MLVLARFSSAGKFGDDGWQQIMLGGLDPRLQGFGGVVRPYLDLLLGDDFTGVHSLVDVVHGATGDLITGGEGLGGGSCPAVLGKERGMHVDDASRECSEEGGTDDTHEAGEDDQLNLFLAQDGDKFFLRGGIEASTRETRHDALGTRPNGAPEFENPCPRLIGEHRGDACGQKALIDVAANGGQVRAVPRTEDAQAEQV